MRVVFAGTPAAALPALIALLDSPRHEVVAVVTRPDAPAGRGRALVASPVSALAAERGLPVLTPARPREPEFLEALAAIAPDCCPVVAYGALIPPAALEIPSYGWVNLHFSVLPAWRGAAPVQHALMHGDDVTGATTFLLDEGLDTGPVLGVLTETVRATDTAGDLLARLADAGAHLLVATLDALEDGSLGPQEQPTEGVSLAPKVSVDDARVDWTLPATAIDRRVRGCTPAPGAWTTFRAARLKLGPVSVLDTAELAPGELALTGGQTGGARVGTGSADVALGWVQAAGRGVTDGAAWARGARPTAGERLA